MCILNRIYGMCVEVNYFPAQESQSFLKTHLTGYWDWMEALKLWCVELDYFPEMESRMSLKVRLISYLDWVESLTLWCEVSA